MPCPTLLAAPRNITAAEGTSGGSDDVQLDRLIRIETRLGAGALGTDDLAAALAEAGVPNLARILFTWPQ